MRNLGRRNFLKLLGGGLAAAVLGGAALKREEIIAFLDADKAAARAGQVSGQVSTRYYAPLKRELSLLGFGCMRFPTRLTASGKQIDEELSKKMVDFAYRHGINYSNFAHGKHPVCLDKSA